MGAVVFEGLVVEMNGANWKQLLMTLFVNDSNGKASHTKLFSVVASVVLLVMFVYVVATGTETSIELWVVMGGLLVGNRTANKLIEAKYSNRNGESRS